MDYIVIAGVRPYDGRYEFDLVGQELTTREWGWIKRLSEYLPLTIEPGFAGGDPELYAVFAAIALRRAGRITNQEVPDVFDRIIDSPQSTTIRLEGDSEREEDDAGPPPPSSNGSTSTSGPASVPSSESSDDHLKPSGTPESATSESPPTRSVT